MEEMAPRMSLVEECLDVTDSLPRPRRPHRGRTRPRHRALSSAGAALGLAALVALPAPGRAQPDPGAAGRPAAREAPPLGPRAAGG